MIGSHQPFYLPYQGRNDRELQSRYGSLVCRVLASKYPTPPALPDPPAANEVVRLGIVSGFFRQHSNWKIPLKGWLKQLDRTRFHVSGYYTSGERDAETAVAEGLCDRFVQGPLSLDDWRRTIQGDAPHVLIFPEIGMDKVTAQLAGTRLAATQCCSWGHPVTSGFPTIDYFLSSDLMEPEGADDHYSERLIRLPNLSIHYEPLDHSPVGIDRAELGLRADAVVYWCCQSLPKYLPQFDRVFARIAAGVPDCQFTFIEFGGGRGVTDLFPARDRSRRPRSLRLSAATGAGPFHCRDRSMRCRAGQYRLVGLQFGHRGPSPQCSHRHARRRDDAGPAYGRDPGDDGNPSDHGADGR